MRRYPETPYIPLGPTIPKIIHQKFSTEIPGSLKETVKGLALRNPQWDHRLYDDEDASRFISEHYGESFRRLYDLISPQYGAARADFFRYLVMYRFGGVYVDLKSHFSKSIDEVLSGNEYYILAKWRNGAGEIHENWGLHAGYDFEGGEFQQWHIIAAPGHPFLRAVIDRVVRNIVDYDPVRCGVGRIGVLKTTGPIAYTEAIEPILDHFPHTRFDNEGCLSLIYSALPRTSHISLFKNHYTSNSSPVVCHAGFRGWAHRVKLLFHNYKNRLRRTLGNWVNDR